MILSFKLSRKVFTQTLFYMNYSRPVMLLLQILGLGLIGYWLYNKIQNSGNIPSIANFIFGLYFLLFVPLIIFLRALRMSRATSRIMENVQMELDKDVFKINGESYKHEYTWNKIVKVKQTSFAYLIYVSKLQAHIIPMEALSTQEKSSLNALFRQLNGPVIRLKKN